MGVHQIPPEFAEHMVKRGDPGRNPTGNNGQRTRIVYRRLKQFLDVEGDLPCPYDGYEGMTNAQALVKRAYRDAIVDGNAAARKWISDRKEGRVPYLMAVKKETSIELDARIETAIDLPSLTDEELVTLAEEAAAATRREIAERRRAKALEAVPVEPLDSTVEPNDLGAAPVGPEPKEP